MGHSKSTLRSPVLGPTAAMPIQFYVLCGNEPARASVNVGNNLVELFMNLREDPIMSRIIPAKVMWNDCTFYKLKKPVLFAQPRFQEGDAFLCQAKQKCKEVENRSHVEPTTTTICQLAEQFSPDHAYLVIELPDPPLQFKNATKELRQNHAALFERLQVKVKVLGSWAVADVEENQKDGAFTEDIAELPPTFKDIQDALEMPRFYKASDVEGNQDYEIMRKWYNTQFERVFTPVETEPPTVVKYREFAAFYNLLRGFNEDVLRIASHEISSSFKASNFAVHFVHPPFFSLLSHRFEYQQDTSWGFPIFAQATNDPNTFRKYTPRSDCMVVSPQFQIPFVICEVISDKHERDRSRMLVQAVALARTGQFLLRPASTKKFFVVAIYVDANMVASRYIVMEVGDGDACNDLKPVSIHQKDFDLREKDNQVDFLREMYNLATRIDALSSELAPSKQGYLHEIYIAASEVTSLSDKDQTQTMDDTTMHSSEDSMRTGGLQDEDDLGVFKAEDIQDILCRMNYKIEFILYGHPYLAMMVNKAGGERRYLKFVEQDKEVKILKYLAAIRSPSNHTISGVQFWPVEGGTVISMPGAGGWLTSLKNRNEHLWSVALQLVEAVAFMHEHNVAHMDLKPHNVIIPPEGGRLSIIDFSVSIHVRSADAKYRGVVGTEDYVAPEVREGQYKPMLADLWSCGRTLEEFCAGCHPSEDCAMLLQISRQLMHQDPEARPKMSAVLEWMALTKREDNVVSHTRPVFPMVHTPAHQHSLLSLPMISAVAEWIGNVGGQPTGRLT